MTEDNGTIWDRTPPGIRKPLIWVLWFVTWAGLVGGLFDRVYFEFVVWFSAAHALLFLVLFGFDIKPFPVQVRIAYFVWVAVGTYVPYMIVLMYITLVGLATNLFLGYCPLARRVFFSPPVAGKFKPASS